MVSGGKKGLNIQYRLVKGEWDAAEKWLKKVQDERKRRELELQSINQLGNY